MLRYLRRITLVVADLTGIILAAGISFTVLQSGFPNHTLSHVLQLLLIFVMTVILGVCIFAYRGHYSWRTPWWQQVKQVTLLCICAALCDVLINYVALDIVKAQVLLTLTWALAIPAILLSRLAGRKFLKRMNHWNIATVLVGNAQNVIDTIVALKSEFYLSYDIQYVVMPNAREEDLVALHNDCPGVMVRENFEIEPQSMIILCPGESNNDFVQEMVLMIRKAGAKFAIVPPTSGFSLYGLQPQYFFGYNIVLMEAQYRLRTFSGRLTKMLLDRSMALVGLIMLAPVFLFLMIKVRKDGGPSFYGQTRVGKDGKPFKCWKFRSMATNADELLKEILATDPAAAEEWAKDFKLKNDPRITKIGHFLRKSSLDEIPQLYNVLCGEMSIVGPRPIVTAEEVYYGDKMEIYRSVRPGITGLWQVSGRNDVTYNQRVALDMWYVDNWSIWNDLVIIFKTSFVVLYRKGAY